MKIVEVQKENKEKFIEMVKEIIGENPLDHFSTLSGISVAGLKGVLEGKFTKFVRDNTLFGLARCAKGKYTIDDLLDALGIYDEMAIMRKRNKYNYLLRAEAEKERQRKEEIKNNKHKNLNPDREVCCDVLTRKLITDEEANRILNSINRNQKSNKNIIDEDTSNAEYFEIEKNKDDKFEIPIMDSTKVEPYIARDVPVRRIEKPVFKPNSAINVTSLDNLKTFLNYLTSMISDRVFSIKKASKYSNDILFEDHELNKKEHYVLDLVGSPIENTIEKVCLLNKCNGTSSDEYNTFLVLFSKERFKEFIKVASNLNGTKLEIIILDGENPIFESAYL